MPTSGLVTISRWSYRVRQFWGRLWAHARPLDDAAARQVLAPDAYKLFGSMPRGDQMHALCVLMRLGQRGKVLPELAQAALLHDVGKTAGRLGLAHRVAIVLLEALSPTWLGRLGSPRPGSWRFPFFVHRHHAALGAEQCARAGCPPLTVALVRWHREDGSEPIGPDLYEPLMALRAADDAC